MIADRASVLGASALIQGLVYSWNPHLLPLISHAPHVLKESRVYDDHRMPKTPSMPEDESLFIQDVELKWLLFNNVTRFRLSICADKKDYKVEAEAAKFKTLAVWSDVLLNLSGLQKTTIVDFTLYSLSRLSRSPRFIGCTQIPIADMLNREKDYDSELLLLGRSSLPTAWLRISFSKNLNLKEVTGRLVEGVLPPKDHLSRVGPVLGHIVAANALFDILAESHPIAKLTWSIVSIGVDILKNQNDMKEEVAELYGVMKSTYKEASQDDVLQKMEIFSAHYETLFDRTISCVRFLEEYAKKGFFGRLVDLEIFGKVKRFREGFQLWNKDLHDKIDKERFKMEKQAKEQEEINKHIRKLGDAIGSFQSFKPKSESTCMKGTRIQAIGKIENWINRCDGGTFWCHGMAGTGKSSLMATLHERLIMGASDSGKADGVDGDERTSVSSRGAFLAAFIRYDRNTKASTDGLIPTIAHFLCYLNPDVYPDIIRTAISRVVRDNQNVLNMSSSSEQFRLLLQQPLTSIRRELENKPSLVIVVDGLDECKTSDEMLAVLAKGFGPDLPFMRLIVSSRPVRPIKDIFSAEIPQTAQLDLNPSPYEEAHQDIQFYIDSRFRTIFKTRSSAGFKSLCEELHAVEKLTIQAKGWFIWAVTVCNIIDALPSKINLQKLLDTSLNIDEQSMTTIYQTALDAVIPEIKGDMQPKQHILELKQYIREVLVTIVAAGQPINVQTFNKAVAPRLGGLDPFRVLEMLGSVVQISGDAIQPVHGTFFDFLEDKEKCGDDWYIDVEQEGPKVRFRLHVVEMGFDLDNPVVQDAYHALFPAAQDLPSC